MAMATNKSTPASSVRRTTKRPEGAVAAKPAARHPWTTGKRGVTAEQRAQDIAVAAYYIAERRGFSAGDPLADWVQAEAEIDGLWMARPNENEKLS